MTPVVNQGSCGSCYAFASVGSIESKIYINTGVLQELSAQQLVDCTRGFGNQGCLGGSIGACFQYAQSFPLQSADSYPYRGQT